MNNMRHCMGCEELLVYEKFIPCGSNMPFGKDGVSHLCFECASKRISPLVLDDIDKLCQLVDLPFIPDLWIQSRNEETEVKQMIIAYCEKLGSKEEYAKTSWKEQTLMWEKARETKDVMALLPTLSADLFLYLRKKWGSHEDFGIEDYLKMESYEKNTLNYYNFRDEARRDMIRKLGLVSVLIDKKLAEGATRDVGTLLSSYQSLMKESGIQNAVHNDTETIESLSELVAYLEKNGWLMDYKVTESRDIVDATIRNFQQYVKSLVTGSGEEISQMYQAKISEAEQGTELTEEEVESMFATIESEEEFEDDESLDESELIDMFKEVSKTYGE